MPQSDSFIVVGDVSGVLYAVEFADLGDCTFCVLKIKDNLLGLIYVVLQGWFISMVLIALYNSWKFPKSFISNIR